MTLGLLVLQLIAFSSMSDAQFHGELMTCDLEGEDVPVPPEVAKVEPCIACTCVNKIVKCSKKRCPSLEGCYWRLMTLRSECCQECKGCVHHGTTYKHGSMWSDGCQHYECQSGVLTVSHKHCHVPCYTPLPPLGSGCCPRCEGCWLEGRRVPEGEVVTSKIDPCVRCVCFDGKLTCEKRSCPVLSCPETRQVLSHDGCCMTCRGSRPMITPPGGRCFLTGYLYMSGAERSVDPCTTCTCSEGFITCERRTCPVLNCSQEFQVTHENECCPSCSAAAQLESVCHEFGTIYRDGDTWQLDKCTSCSCDDGKVTCHVLPCEYYNKPCPPGYRRVESDSECCPRCEKAPGVCVVFGDPHYRTFDGLLFNFQGACKYWLAKTCKGQDFSLKVINDARRSSHFSWTKSLSFKVPGAKVTLGQNLRVKINGKKTKPPYTMPGVLQLTLVGQAVSITTPKGINVLWDGGSYVEVEVPVALRGRTCGLCGNFNGNATDDLTTKDGRRVATADLMALSWATGRARICSRRMKAQQEAQNKSLGTTRSQRLTCPVSRSKALGRCSLLNSTSFQPCHATNAVDKYYESCILDMCECRPGRRCECDTLQAYARVCQRLGTPVLDWRNQSKCGGLECPRGAEYMECAPPCRATCSNPTPNPNCYKLKCRAGCYCPPPSVLHRGACIPVEECPKRGKKRHRNR